MDISTLERDGWNRISHYSALYDFDASLTGPGVRTPAQKFVIQGNHILKMLVARGKLTQHLANTCFQSIITQIKPGTMNGGAIAVVFTTYFPLSENEGQFLFEPDPKAKGHFLQVQKEKCWKTLVHKIDHRTDPVFNELIDELGLTSADLFRYFLMLRRRKQEFLGGRSYRGKCDALLV